MRSDDVETSGGWALNALTDLAVGGAEHEPGQRAPGLVELLETRRELKVFRATVSKRRTLIGTGYRTLAEVASEGSLHFRREGPERLHLEAACFRSGLSSAPIRSGALWITSLKAELVGPVTGRARWSAEGQSVTTKLTGSLLLRVTVRSVGDEEARDVVLWPERITDVNIVCVLRRRPGGELEARLRFVKKGLLWPALGGRAPRVFQLSAEATASGIQNG